jgi:hypothetical protein
MSTGCHIPGNHNQNIRFTALIPAGIVQMQLRGFLSVTC